MTLIAISPRLATRRQSKRGFTRSHPKDAVAGRRERRAVRGRRQAQTEHPAGVDRIDDAVVPEPSGRVVRRALLLVLRADRCGERLLFLGRPRAAAGFDAVPANGREYG